MNKDLGFLITEGPYHYLMQLLMGPFSIDRLDLKREGDETRISFTGSNTIY